MRAGISFFQTPVNVDIFTSFHELLIFLMASRKVNPSRGFQLTFPKSMRRIIVICSCNLTKCISQIIRLKSQNYSLIHGLQNGCCVNRHFQHESCTSSSELLGDHVHCQWIVSLNSRLKILSKPCCIQMCDHPDIFFPFVEHWYNRFTIILETPRIFRMVSMY